MIRNHTQQSGYFFWRWGLVCALCVTLAMPTIGQDATEESTVEVTDYDTVTLQVTDTDLAQVLEMLAIQSKKNIITSKSVSATISANLFDVTFYEALDAILYVNGYQYEEQDNFIYIYTQTEWEEREAARRQTESRVFELDFMSASDANELITPLLSESGTSAYRGDVIDGIETDMSDVGADHWAFSAKLVVSDYPDRLESIETLLNELDTPPQQVLVESVILQTTLDENNAFGVDFSVLGSLDFTDLANPLSAVNGLLTGADAQAGGFQPLDNNAQAATSSVGGTQGPGGLKIGILSNDISVFVRVLDEVTDTTVMARPKVMCLNRQRAEVLVGRRVGYLSTTATETTTTQTVEFLDTGIHLVFRPFINKDGMIRLELAPSTSIGIVNTVTAPNGQAVTIPDELTNELTTNVRVRDGETLVLGGLFRERTAVSRRQIPLLGDIPILGAAFRGQDDEVEREEIIFLITPSIVQDQTLWEMGEDTLELSDAVVVGARSGLLPFSNYRMTDNYNQDAVDAYRHGDLERALLQINNSLRLNTDQPEMIRFREEVTGAIDQPYERGVLNRVIRKKLGELYDHDLSSWAPEPLLELEPEARGDVEVNTVSWNIPMDGTDPYYGEWNQQQRLFYTGFLYEFFSALDMPELCPDFRTATDIAAGVEFPTSTDLNAEGDIELAEVWDQE